MKARKVEISEVRITDVDGYMVGKIEWAGELQEWMWRVVRSPRITGTYIIDTGGFANTVDEAFKAMLADLEGWEE